MNLMAAVLILGHMPDSVSGQEGYWLDDSSKMGGA